MSNCTKGEWVAKDDRIHSLPAGSLIGSFYGYDTDEAEDLANARLAAAAEGALAVLDELRQRIESEPCAVTGCTRQSTTSGSFQGVTVNFNVKGEA